MDRQREAIPNGGTNHCKGTFLPGGGACKWYTEKTLIGGTEGARAPCTLYGATELNKIGRSKAQQTTPYQCSHPIFYSLPSRKPVQDVAHIDRDVVYLDDLVKVMILNIKLLMRFCRKLVPHMEVVFLSINSVRIEME